MRNVTSKLINISHVNNNNNNNNNLEKSLIILTEWEMIHLN